MKQTKRKKGYPRRYFYIMGTRPVKVLYDEAGRAEPLSFNWQTGEFELDWNTYLLRLHRPGSDVDSVTESEFEKYVEELRMKLNKNEK